MPPTPIGARKEHELLPLRPEFRDDYQLAAMHAWTSLEPITED
jgi:hypothetical protein